MTLFASAITIFASAVTVLPGSFLPSRLQLDLIELPDINPLKVNFISSTPIESSSGLLPHMEKECCSAHENKAC